MLRRHLVALTTLGAGAVISAAPAQACTIVGARRARFSERACRSSLIKFVELLNDAPSISANLLEERVDSLWNFEIEDEWIEKNLGDKSASDTRRQYTFLREFTISDGKPDPKPIEIEEINLLRRLDDRATYEFTVKRFSFHQAATDLCFGEIPERFSVDRLACLATFEGNRLRTIRRFPEWHLERTSNW